MDSEGLENRIKDLFSQAKPIKAKRKVRPIFLILLIFAVVTPLAISQTPQEQQQRFIYYYPVPLYQSQVQKVGMTMDSEAISTQRTWQTSVGCSILKVVQPIQPTSRQSKNI